MAVKVSDLVKGLVDGGYTVTFKGEKAIVARGGQPVATFLGSTKLDERQVDFIQKEVRKGTTLLESVQNGGSTRQALVKRHPASTDRPPSGTRHAVSGAVPVRGCR